MHRLGYQRWVAQGGDWGSAVVEAISRQAPEGFAGMHVNLPMVFPTPAEETESTADERRMIDRATHYGTALDGYAREMSTRPQTVGYSLADSPAGLASWVCTLFEDVAATEVSRDDILDDVMLYWLPNAGASSARLYWEAAHEPWEPLAQNPAPAGFSIFPGEAVQASQRWIERRYSHVLHYRQLEHGGHFAALEQPELLTEEIRTTFRTLRTPSAVSAPATLDAAEGCG